MLANGPPWIKAGGVLKGLDQVGFHGVLKQSGHGSLSVEVMGCDRLTIPGIGYHHFCQAAASDPLGLWIDRARP